MTSPSKNVCIDKLDHIVNKCNNTYHGRIKIKPVDVKPSIYIDFDKEHYKDGPKFKVGDHVTISKYKNIFAKGYVPNWFENFLIKKVKNTLPRTYVISDVNGEEIAGTFYKREFPKLNQKEFRVEKIIKRKDDKLYLNWKGYDSSFNSWIDKKDIIWMSKCFPKSKSFGGRVKVELDLSIYTTKDDLKNATGVDTSDFAKKTDLTNLKSDVG